MPMPRPAPTAIRPSPTPTPDASWAIARLGTMTPSRSVLALIRELRIVCILLRAVCGFA